MHAVVRVVVVGMTLVAAQGTSQPRELLNAPRALTPDEIDIVVHAAQAAIAGRTFHLATAAAGREGDGIEVEMGDAGRPQRIRVTATIVSGTVAGVSRDGRPQGTSTPPHLETRTFEPSGNGGPGISPIFEMLQGSVPLTSGEFEHRQIGDRQARALVAHWSPPATQSTSSAMTIGDPAPNVAGHPPPEPRGGTQRLWIDTSSLLPLRWEASTSDKDRRALDFVYARP